VLLGGYVVLPERINELFIITLLIFLSACADKTSSYLKNFDKARNFYINKNLNKAILYLDKTLKLNPDYQPALILLGKAYYYSGNKNTAKEIFHKLLDKNPDSIDALTWLVRIEGIDENKIKKGLEYCNRILKNDSDNYMAHFFKGMMYDINDKTKQAIIEYNTALQLEKIIYLAHIQLGNLYERKGLKDKAVVHFKKALMYNINSVEKFKLKEKIKENEK